MSANFNRAGEAGSGPGDPEIADLVNRARDGDQQAWEALVDRYSPLVWAICRSYHLNIADAADVGQAVWLHLLEQLGVVRDPAALTGWLATMAKRECVRVLRGRELGPGPPLAGYVPAAGDIPDDHGRTGRAELLAAEYHAALRDAFSRLPACCRQLISLICAEPPVPFAEISARLGLAVENIGPYQSRCLDKLRRDPALAALINSDGEAAQGCHDGR